VKRQKLIREIDELRANSKNVRFERLCTIAEALGFEFSRQHGSHKIYVLRKAKEILDIQDIGGRAKSYQVKQFIDLVDKYGLLVGEGDV
jgi:hypothetical protein